ncbi:MAG: hypothetical protein FJX45_03555 [Alphaproteobacteria bacterium]|nr:hypothetical protein [Alphaproteobacteria bacterium]MBM3654697.1 hypothetical protein [Alphaproteobacteria bacterium]
MTDQMRPIETGDSADIEPLWAVRANAKLYAFRWPNIVLSGISCSWLFYAMSGGPTADLIGLAGVAAISYPILLLGHYYMKGKRLIYVGSRRGISTCYCVQESCNVLFIKYSLESYDYDIATSVKIFEFNSGFAISFGRSFAASSSGGGASLFKPVPASPLSIDKNPYYSFVFELDKTGVWINNSHKQCQDMSIDKNIVRHFISMKAKRIRYMPILFLNDAIFCDKEHAEMIVGSILSSDRFVELQKAGTAL